MDKTSKENTKKRRSKSRAAAVSPAELLLGMIGIDCGVCGDAAAPEGIERLRCRDGAMTGL